MFVKNNSIPLETCGEGIARKILSRGGNLMMVENIFKRGAVGAVHTHIHEQVAYIAKGSFKFDLNGKCQVLEAGDSVYVPSNQPHGVVALEEDSIIVDIFTPQREDFLKK